MADYKSAYTFQKYVILDSNNKTQYGTYTLSYQNVIILEVYILDSNVYEILVIGEKTEKILQSF